MIRNGQFNGHTDGWWYSGAEVVAQDNQACIDIQNPGTDPWSVILGHGGVGLAQSESYQLSFDAYAESETQFKTLIQHEGPPYTHHFIVDTEVGPSKKHYQYDFTQTNDSDARAEFQFQLGAQNTGRICVSNVSLIGNPYMESVTISPIRANQLGFLPQANKYIYVQSEQTQPLDWTLVDQNGVNIDAGKTQYLGVNKASAEQLHRVDLSHYSVPLTQLVLKVGEHESFAFDIRDSIYHSLKYDALSYFYQNRSGIDIKADFVQRPDLARPAGHLPDIARCFDQKDAWGNSWPGCDLTMDVTGGWYDAGDHGKYVVNSGITVWTLLNLYERGQWLENAKIPFAEGGVKIPEAGNGVNPLLSEVRWNVEFMLAMQIPSGQKLFVPKGDQSADKTLRLSEIDASDMVFHKVADGEWTGAPLAPHEDTQSRYVGQPSTAATLNLAAISAQCARIWKDIDAEFSARCLSAAERAWQAANRHPDVFAYDNFTGSGPYDDVQLDDEFYWAATELFITTADSAYLKAMRASRYFLMTPSGKDDADSDMFWQFTAPMATLSLAVVENALPQSEINQARKNLLKTAEAYLTQSQQEGYDIPFTVEQYPWGSNSSIANRALFLVYAHDFTKRLEFIKAAANSMDYLLGANPMNISYITGYGAHAAEQPHHRFWANSVDENYPKPAPGALIGGPNSISFSDPVAGAMKGNCVGQTCYVDNMHAWTMNEITINWNAPLVWLASALDEGQLD
ncbi:glycosyl hydrolase [Reinekea thalattae]|uniref:Endoglucanase n=2 Tax=Reinekea thalattae TaxID=2593301 RepID=A0A5C8ZA61_9GAMM|nr:glycosyl hydrolase [Reinekea thalattae]